MRARLTTLFSLVTLLLWASAASGAPDAGVSVAAASPDARGVTYQLAVGQPDRPVLVILPRNTRVARLTRDGQTLEAGRELNYGWAPLGHAIPSFRLEGLHPGESIALRVEPASLGPPQIVAETGVIDEGIRAARYSGIFFGLILATALLQLAAFWITRDLSILLFLFALACVAAIEATKDDIIPVNAFGTPGLTFLVLNWLISIAMIAFIASFLRLRRDAPEDLRNLIIGGFGLPAVVAVITLGTPAYAAYAEDIRSATAVVVLLFILNIIVRRWRAGFTPAAFLLVAILGTTLAAVYRLFVDHVGPLVPLFDRWSYEIGVAFDLIVVSLGIAFRARYMLSRNKQLERSLYEAEFAAKHDQLTGLLNRRGLDNWVSAHGLRGVLLFIDLDGFKYVNDHGGHEAGDKALVAVADVLRTSVRQGDAIARTGGDEFVIILGRTNVERSTEIAERIRKAIGALDPLGNDHRMGASIGLTELEAQVNLQTALAAADQILYKIKAAHAAAAAVPDR